MDNFFVRSTQCFAKPVWDREDDVLQLFYDDDMSDLTVAQGAAYPGGNVAFVATASVYSRRSLAADCAKYKARAAKAGARPCCARPCGRAKMVRVRAGA